MNVYFDDLQITHTKSKIVQMDDYYPFGLAFNSFKREDKLANKFKFQGQEHIDDLGLNWDSFKWRNHQPDIGRFFNIDPLAESYVYNSPYAFSENKVVAHVELEGLEAKSVKDEGILGLSVTAAITQGGNSGSIKVLGVGIGVDIGNEKRDLIGIRDGTPVFDSKVESNVAEFSIGPVSMGKEVSTNTEDGSKMEDNKTLGIGPYVVENSTDLETGQEKTTTSVSIFGFKAESALLNIGVDIDIKIDIEAENIEVHQQEQPLADNIDTP